MDRSDAHQVQDEGTVLSALGSLLAQVVSTGLVIEDNYGRKFKVRLAGAEDEVAPSKADEEQPTTTVRAW